MRKKIYGLLTAVFLLFACVFASACGDRYKKMEFKIMYAFSESASESEWYDASQGILLNYGAEDDKLVFDENGYAKVFLKVEILNVKAKYIDTINVSANFVGGLESVSSQTVVQDQIFSVTLTGSVQTELKFSEINSGKETTIDFDVYKSLESIHANEDAMPALVIGQTIDLSTLNNIVYNPHGTNQTGVEYSVVSVGYYGIAGDKNSYTQYLGIDVPEYVTIAEGTSSLSVSGRAEEWLHNANVVRIKATSLYSTEESPKETMFDIYLVEPVESTVKPEILYMSGLGVGDTVELYSITDYSSVSISVQNQIESIYALDGVNTSKGKAKYKLVFYVGDRYANNFKKYDLEQVQSHEDIKIEEYTDGLNTYYKLIYVKSSNLTNIIKVAYELEGLNIVGSQKPQSSDMFAVTKKVLPTEFKINGTEVQNGDSVTHDVFTNSTYRGLAVKVEVNPTNSLTSSTLKEKVSFVVDDTNLEVRDSKNKVLNGSQEIYTGDTIYVKFKTSSSNTAQLTFTTRSNPEKFAGEDVDPNNITATCTFNKKVTADSMLAYANEGCTESSIYVDAVNGSYVYVKAYYSAGTLDASTMRLVSNNPELTFGSQGKSNILLSDLEVGESGNLSDAGGNYYRYRVPVKTTNPTTDVMDYSFKMIAGDSSVGLEYNIRVKSVYVATNTSFKVQGMSENIATFDEKNIYAITKDSLVEFSVVDGLDNDYTVESLTVTYGDKFKVNTGEITTAEVLLCNYMPNNLFSVRGLSAGATQYINVKVKYYSNSLGYIRLTETLNDIPVQIAVYDPIGRINATLSSREICYVNEQFEEVNEVKVSIRTLTSSYGTPASVVTFYDAVSGLYVNKTGVSGLNISFGMLHTEVANNTLDISFDSEELLSERKFNDKLEGEIVVKLNNKIENVSAINLVVSALQFGRKTDVVNNVTINVVEAQTASGITVSGNEIIKDNSKYQLQLSYMDAVVGNFVVKEFNAKAEYGTIDEDKKIFDDLGFLLYEYEVDENGNIVKDENGNEKLTPVAISDRLYVEITDGVVRVSSKVGSTGGTYKLQIVTLDSYENGTYSNAFDIMVRVSDGSKKYKFLISTTEEFYQINNNVNAHYALVADINLGATSPVGYSIIDVGGTEIKEVNAFNGELTTDGGEGVAKHTIFYTVSEGIQSTTGAGGYLYGLFSKLGSSAIVTNIALNINIAVDATVATSYVGALAGINESANVKDVDVTINTNSYVKINDVQDVDESIYFGGFVGVNTATAKIENSTITYLTGINADTTVKCLNISSVATNVVAGMFVGNNEGAIIGKYEGNEDLDSVAYDVLGYLNITNGSNKTNNSFNVGGVAGISSGTISQVLVGGLITLTDAPVTGVKDAVGFAGGIAGSVVTSTVTTAVALGLDINADNTKMVVGGAVGYLNTVTNPTDQAKLIDVKVVTVKLKNDGVITKGTLSAANSVVGGMVGKSTNAIIERSGIQNFIKGFTTVDTFNAQGSLEVIKSYIMNNGYIEFVENTTKTYKVTYNADDIYVNGTALDLTSYFTETTSVTETNFVGMVEVGLYIDNAGKFEKVQVEDGFDDATTYYISSWDAFDVADIEINANWWAKSDVNFVKVTDYEYNFYFPYFKDIIIIQPNDIKTELNQTYILEVDSIYVDDYDNSYTDEDKIYTISETVFVNYRYLQGENNIARNKHEIQKLINLELSPSDAQGGLRYEVLGIGYQYAYITYENQIPYIVFIGASNDTPIIVKIYSLFNEDVVAYVQFHTMLGVSDMTLSSNSINNIGENSYTLDVYTGGKETLLSIGAENVIDGENYQTLLDVYGIEEYIEVVCTNEVDPSLTKLAITQSNNKTDFTIRVNTSDIIAGEQEKLHFVLKFNITKFFDPDTTLPAASHEFVDIASAEVLVRIYYAAEKITTTTDAYDVSTNENITITAHLHSGFVNLLDRGKTESYKLIEGNSVIVEDNDKDAIKLTFNCVEGADELSELLSRAGVSNINELFDFNITSRAIEGDEEIEIAPSVTVKEVLGYTYNVLISLKDEFNYRYITKNIRFDVVVCAVSDFSVSTTVELLFMPTEVSTVRIENYSVNKLDVDVDNRVNLIQNNNAETSIITPGGKGSMMFIYVEPSYSNIVKAVLSTSELRIPSKTDPVSLKFIQYVYNDAKSRFETLKTGHNQIGNNLELSKITGYDANGIPYYTGILYVHAQLEHFSGVEDTIVATLTVETSSGVKTPVKKPLLTTYLPGADITFQGQKLYGNNVVEEGSYNNLATIKVHGYQFNSNPTIRFGWNLNGVNKTKMYYPTANTETLTGITQESFITKLAEKEVTFLWYIKDNKYYSTEEFVEGVSEYILVKDYSTITNGTNSYLIGNYINYYLENDYTEVVYNPADASYSMNLLFSVKRGIPAAFHISASLSLITKDGQLATSQQKYAVIQPTDYIIQSVSVARLANNSKVMLVGNTDKLDLRFTTANADRDYSADIYTRLVAKYSNNNLANLFSYYNGGEINLGGPLGIDPKFEVNVVNNQVAVTALAQFNGTISFKIRDYGYKFDENTGKYVLDFNVGGYTLSSSFRLAIYPLNAEEYAIPIETASDFTGMQEGQHYILMNDIELNNYTPISTAIGSLDGNNRLIKINSFSKDAETSNYGLFAQIGTYTAVEDEESGVTVTAQTILKNVMVDYGNCETIVLTDNTATNLVFGGLAAVNNGGLIYNCDVISTAQANRSINIYVDDSANTTITFGGLVGENSGIITNSRVGRSSYTRIEASKTYESTVEVNLRSLQFTISNNLSEAATNKFNVVSGGFVGRNTGTISSSYIANTSLINYSTSESNNKTSGFVAINSGVISYSYVKALENTITREVPYSTGAVIENKGNGIVAGFAYENSGEISNSFANTELVTKSAYIAGFVYENKSNGKISSSYAAATMNSGNAADISEQPFVGINKAGVSLSNGKLDNVYYLMIPGTTGIVNDYEKDQATPLDLSNFQDYNNLIGFVFVNSNSQQEREQGTWSYFTKNNEQHILPELTNANMVAHSYRFVAGEDDNKNVYTNAVSYAPGTKNNPYIIRNVDEYNTVFAPGGMSTGSNYNSMTGYVRLINNINFGEDETAIKTRVKYILGDETIKSNITSFDGNGMVISGIYLDVTEANNKEIGLFSRIENAYIKNLNLKFAIPKSGNQFSTTDVMYSGGLAGKINNSAIINVSLDGSSTTLTGKNFVGGVAGLISGQSMIYNVTSNLSVKAGNTSTSEYLYYNQKDYFALGKGIEAYDTYLTKLSYAGGIAGVLDLETRKNTTFNVSFVEVHGDEMYSKTFNNNIEANILADYAGGIAGYASKNTASLKLKYYTGEKDLIRGDKAAGGLYGVLLGTVTASQVTADEDVQYSYDTELGKYVIAVKADSKTTLDKTKIGNVNLIESYKYAGGLVGVGIDAQIHASYAKAGFKSGVEIGGLIGVSVASSVSYSYAVPYINYHSSMQHVGGLFGSTYQIANASIPRNGVIAEFEALAKLNGTQARTTDIQFTFSTLLLDNNEITKNKTEITTNHAVFDYISANSTVNDLTSNGTEILTYVFAGKVNGYEDVVTNQNAARSSSIDLYRLYDHTTSEYVTVYADVFTTTWSTIKYWTFDNTKYFPLLLSNAVENFIPIRNAGDFYQLTANPKGNFKIVVEEIDMAGEGWETESNWIFNCTFEGTLIGDAGAEENGSSKKPVVTGLQLEIQSEDETTGLFRQTKNANISNISFVWTRALDPAIQTAGKKVTDVGGVSCDDEGSTFTNIDVTVPQTTASQPSATMITAGTEIRSFGGIVAKGTNSNILACSFTGSVDVELSGDNTYFGGIVGYGDFVNTQANEDGTEETVSMTVVNSSVGLNKAPANFKIKASGTNNYIGNIIGWTKDASISGNKSGSTSYETEYQYVNTTLEINTDSPIYYGGIVGHAKDTAISRNDALVNLTATKENGGTTPQPVYLGGLAGYYTVSLTTTDYIIRESNANVNFDLTGIKQNTPLFMSGGIGAVNGTTEITQCLFTGDIYTEHDEAGTITTATNIEKLVAGGVVGYVASSSNVAIRESMSYVDMIIGTAKTVDINAGGIVGEAESAVTVEFSASAGKIVPITSNKLEEENAICIGGMVGKSTQSLTINNSYTTSSIIASGVVGNAITRSQMQAVVGFGTATFDKVYFASDLALVPDAQASDVSGQSTSVENIGLVNLAVNTLIYSQDWRTNFNTYLKDNQTIQVWKDLEKYSDPYSGQHRLPYILALESALADYGIFDTSTEDYDYVEGTSLRPQKVYISSNMKFNEEFTYYLYTPSDEKTFVFESSISDVEKTLNGVLIGSEAVFKFNAFNQFGTTNVPAGIIPKVAKYSAVSNMHVLLESDITDAHTSGAGIIVGQNEGVVFNSSVQGTDINIATTSGLGLITRTNNGLVSHSFSSAEIVNRVTETTEIKVSKVSGIVYLNTGVVSTCYFTGYIEGDQNAGIIRDISATDTEDSYVYNNYMAGVITNVATTRNSFTSSSVNIPYASNNFIDKFASVRDAVVEDGITKKETDDLLDGAILKGHWHTVLVGKKIDTSKESFGFNYGYPVYKFNKVAISSKQFSRNYIAAYQLYTGNGRPSTDAGKDYSLEDRYIRLYNESCDDYNNAFKIPHLGILSAVQGLLANQKELTAEATTKDHGLNYVLIYDINGKESATSTIVWEALGTNSDYENAVDGFKGVFISNKYYELHQEVPEVAVLDAAAGGTVPVIDEKYSCVIENLAGNGLFDNIHNAYIADITFGEFTALDDSGVLGTKVTESVSITGYEDYVTVYNVRFKPHQTESGYTNTYITATGEGANYGALFGEVVGNLNVNAFNSAPKDPDDETSRLPIVLIGGATTGLIAGKINSEAVVNIDEHCELGVVLHSNKTAGSLVGKLEEATINLNSNIKLHFTNGTIGGGLVGESVKGTIVGSTASVDVEIETMLDDSTNKFNTIGGMVGSGDAKVSNVNVKIGDGGVDTSQLLAVNFGAFIGISKGAEFTNCEIKGQSITIASSTPGSTRAGLFAGVNNAGLTVSEIKVETTAFTIKADNTAAGATPAPAEISGVGALVGYQSPATEEGAMPPFIKLGNIEGTLNCVETETGAADGGEEVGTPVALEEPEETPTLTIKIDTKHTKNLGSLIGYYAGGAIEDIKGGDSGYETVVTLIGTTNVGGAIGHCAANLGAGVLSLLNKPLANIKIENINTNQESYENIGGIFGLLSVAVTEELENKNKITLGISGTVYNVGGIAGKYLTETNDNITIGETYAYTNSADIASDSIKGSNDTVKSYDMSKSNNNNYYARGVNVGGIFGTIENTGTGIITITNMYNTKGIVIQGYQNVGGLFGNIEGNIVVTSRSIEFSEATHNIVYKEHNGETKEYVQDGEGNVISDLTIQQKAATGGGSGTDIIATNANVTGVINVGGVVGYLGAKSEIRQLYINGTMPESGTAEIPVEVKGNTNVGSLVGLADGANESDVATVINNFVKNVNVTGVYYDYTYVSPTNEDVQLHNVYIPTSVGGLIGKTKNTHLEHNIIKNVKVLSSGEGTDQGTGSSYGMISTISNYMVDKDATNDYQNIQAPASEGAGKYNFDLIQTGFGGFVGTVDDVTMNNMGAEYIGILDTSGKIISNNYIVNINVEAQLGINVGTYYGFVNHNKGIPISVAGSASSRQIITPYLYADTNVLVDGGYNIGGIVGGLTGEDNANYIKNRELSGAANIVVQSKLIGMNVGGLIGYLKDNDAQNFALENNQGVNIQINPNHSYNIGGLVGQLEMSTTSGNPRSFTSATVGESSYSVTTVSDLTSTANAENFGGLIGLLKVTGGDANTSTSVIIEGTHYYPFTVNTIQNENYQDADTEYNSEKAVYSDGTRVNLYAQASYVNRDAFEISGSANINLYTADAKNPLTAESVGWHKDYTAFRQLQRCINQSGTWDSLAVIYDAADISYVGTLQNLGLWNTNKKTETVDNQTKEYYELPWEFKDSEVKKKKIYDPTYIVFTIYENEEGSPFLYSRIGIAQPAYEADEGETDDYIFDTISNDDPAWYEWLAGFFITNSTPASLTYLDLTREDNKTRELSYFSWESVENGGGYVPLGGGDKVPYQNDNMKKGEEEAPTVRLVNYFVKNYPSGDATYGSDKGAYFIFTTIYENKSFTPLDGTKTIWENPEEEVLPRSGSLFEVKGIQTTKMKEYLKGDVGDEFGTASIIIGVVVDIIICVATMGVGSAAVAGTKAAAHAAKGAAKAFCKAFAKNMARKIAKAGGKKIFFKTVGKTLFKRLVIANALMLSAYAVIQVNAQANANFGGNTNNYIDISQNYGLYGFLSSTYARQISYRYEGGNWVVRSLSDETIYDDNGNPYTFYSFDRPTDYYSKYYTGYTVELKDGTGSPITKDEVTYYFSTATMGMENLDNTELSDEEKAAETEKAFVELSKGDITEDNIKCEDIVLIDYEDFKIETGQTEINNTNLESYITAIGGDHSLSFETLYNYQEKVYSLIPKYRVENGAYYLDAYSQEYEYVPSQYFINYETEQDDILGTTTILNQEPDVLNNGGLIYVHGFFVDGKYVVKTGTNKYTDNKVEPVYTNGEVTGYTVNGVEKSKVDIEKTAQLKYTRTTADQTGIKGYHFFDTVYYSTTGKVDTENTRYATYAYIGTEAPTDYSEYQGSQYITRLSKDDIVLYFEINSIAESGTEAGVADKNAEEFTTSDTIVVKIYPSTFIDPYKSSFTDADKSESHNYTYDVDGEIEQSVTYYLYEGGYETDANHEMIAMPQEFNSTILYDIDGDGTDENVDVVAVNIDAATVGGTANVNYVAVGKSYKKVGSTEYDAYYYYLNPNSDKFVKTNWNAIKSCTSSSLGEDDSGNGILLSEYFYEESSNVKFDANGRPYVRANNITEYDIEKGSLSKIYFFTPTSTDKEAYNKNKYKTHERYGLYTRYKYMKYTGNEVTHSYGISNLEPNSHTSGGVTTYEYWNGYFVVPNGEATINSGIPTYLVEAVQVTLRGKTAYGYGGFTIN